MVLFSGDMSPQQASGGHLRDWLSSHLYMEFNLNFGDVSSVN
ncbi:7026_t:CDS:2 [Funneliformis geosporum]|nr:7026_t:CDS:2 [Funneliformis geosporum]